MSAQTSYNFHTAHGVAGGLFDISPYTSDSRNNEEADGKVKFGLGVVDGTALGKQVKLPTSASKKENFEGVVMNSHSHEQDFYGDVKLRKGETVGVLKNGRIHVRIAPESEPKYGDAVYLITDGEYAGYFTTETGVSEESYTAVKLNGYYIGAKSTDVIAPAYIKVDKQPEETEQGADAGNDDEQA